MLPTELYHVTDLCGIGAFAEIEYLSAPCARALVRSTIRMQLRSKEVGL